MATLEAAAAEASGKINTLIEHSDGIHAEFEHGLAQLSQGSQHFEADVAGSHATLEALISRINHERQEQTALFHQVAEVLNDLENRLHQLQDRIDHHTEEVRLNIHELAQKATVLSHEVEQGLEEVNHSASDFGNRASEAQSQIDAVVASGIQHLEHAIEALQSQEHHIEESSQKLENYITNDCLPKLHDKAQALADKMLHLTDDIKIQFEHCADEAHHGSDEIVNNLKSEHEQQMQTIMQTAQELEHGLKNTAETIGKVAETVGSAHDAMDTGVKLTNTGFETAVDCFKQIEHILDRFHM